MKKVCLAVLTALLLLGTACGDAASRNVSAEEISVAQDQANSGYELAENRTPDISAIEDEVSASPPDEVKVNLIEGSYIYEVDVPEQAAYYHEYIFTAEVVEVGENYDPYWEPEYVEKHGSVPIYDPCFTKYQLRVTQSIKGDLQQGEVIALRKLGYYNQEEQEYYMVPDSVMPEEGKEYLFLANLDSDTGMYGTGASYGTIPLETSDTEISTYAMTEEEPNRQTIIDQYTAAYENETPFIEDASYATEAPYGYEEESSLVDE